MRMPAYECFWLAVQADKAGIADDAVSIVVPDASVYVPLEELIDFEQEIERLTKEEEKLTKEINRAKGMLFNEKFDQQSTTGKGWWRKSKAWKVYTDDGTGERTSGGFKGRKIITAGKY